MNNITNFKYLGNQIRIVNHNDEPWWVAKDVCDVLGLKNPTVALRSLDSDELTKFNLGGQVGETNLINEPGLYSLILRSRKPSAKRFKRWVTHQVLPTIRKTGAYMTDDVLEQATSDPDFMIGLLQKLKDTKAERDKAIATKAEISRKREASAMGTASAAVRKVKALKVNISFTFGKQGICTYLKLNLSV